MLPEPTTRSTTESTQPNAAMQADAESSSAGAPSTQFHSSGPKPPPSGNFNEHPGRSPSDQAFEDHEPHWRVVAKRYNAEHPEHVATFNTATNDSCLVDGVLDLPRVIAFQRRHGLRQDGMVGPHTVNSAHRTSRAPHHVAVATAAPAEHHAEAPQHAASKTVGTPSAEGKAEAMKMFEEVNGKPGEPSPTTPSGAPVAASVAGTPPAAATAPAVATSAAPKTVGTPRPEGKAEAMKLFEEVNGKPGEPSPTTPSGAPVASAQTSAAVASSAPKTVGTPSPEGKAEAMKLFEEVNGKPGEASPTTPSGAPIAGAETSAALPAAAAATAPKTVGTPSPEGKAEAMKLFAEVNGGPGQPAPATAPKTVGTPSPEGKAEAMKLFEEVNGGPGQPAPAATPKTVGTPSPEGKAEAMKLFAEVNGGPGQPSPTTPSGAPLPPAATAAAPAPHEPPHDVPSVPEQAAPKSKEPEAAAPHPAGEAAAAGAPHAEAPAKPAAGGMQPWDQPNAEGKFTGEHALHISHISRAQVYQAITDVAPGYSHDFKVMMVGHSWIEQHGSAVNNNYMGVEFANPNKPGDQAYTHVRTSTIITRKQYDANPSKYADWKVGTAGRTTIQEQLDRNEQMIYCTEMRNRPAYQNLDTASVAFVHQVQRRIEALQNSAKPEHQKLAADALAGDENAYAQVMTIRDRSIGIAPYNPDGGYPARVIAGINAARADSSLTSLQ
ncbi:MAG TPA: hypothetical protein VGG74_10800 [Kofleriaceae bacterium]